MHNPHNPFLVYYNRGPPIWLWLSLSETRQSHLSLGSVPDHPLPSHGHVPHFGHSVPLHFRNHIIEFPHFGKAMPRVSSMWFSKIIEKDGATKNNPSAFFYHNTSSGRAKLERFVVNPRFHKRLPPPHSAHKRFPDQVSHTFQSALWLICTHKLIIFAREGLWGRVLVDLARVEDCALCLPH